MENNLKGFFISPKILKQERINQSKDYVESLRKSIKYFFKTLKNNQRFSNNENKLSLLSNKLMPNKITKVNSKNSAFFYYLRNLKNVRENSLNSKKIELKDHKDCFKKIQISKFF
jgi:hypothetical protein